MEVKTEVAPTATPGPWTVSGWTSHGLVINAAKDAEGIGCRKYIGYAQGYPHPDDHECTMEEATANAKLIVRAVNSYAALLEALKNTTQTLRLMNVVNTDGPSRAEVRKEIELAEAAISLAEEKK